MQNFLRLSVHNYMNPDVSVTCACCVYECLMNVPFPSFALCTVPCLSVRPSCQPANRLSVRLSVCLSSLEHQKQTSIVLHSRLYIVCFYGSVMTELHCYLFADGVTRLLVYSNSLAYIALQPACYIARFCSVCTSVRVVLETPSQTSFFRKQILGQFITH